MRGLFFLLAFSLLFIQCNNNDDDQSNCTNYTIGWSTQENEMAETKWLVLTDETGTLIASVKEDEINDLTVDVENCGVRVDVTAFSFEHRSFMVDGQSTEIPVYYLRTFLDVPSGFEIKDQEKTMASNRAIAVEGVNTLEELIWPATNNIDFDGTAFIDPEASLLSFQIEVPERHPAFVRIRANGEAQSRYIWIDSVLQADYTLSYGELPLLQPQGPVILPNDALWNYNIYGQNTLFETRIANPIAPALVMDEFGVLLPQNQDISTLRTEAFQTAFASDGRSYNAYYYSENHSGLPSMITTIEPNFVIERANEGMSINVSGESLTALEISLQEQNSTDTRLIWTIYGKAEHFEDFTWPAWPESLSSERFSHLTKNSATPIIVNALQYGSSPVYEDFLRAKGQSDNIWETEQGIRARAKEF
ncbi:MAG: hypothetical protein MI974_10880 [Chitinophagales bacterium]|nr:hypothetical protein [Chitinophagales bacterium]